MSTELDSILDCTLDDLQDLPEFKPFPPGAHKVLATFSKKEIKQRPAIELSFKYVEAIELEGDEEPPAPGDSCSTLFFLNAEGKGQGFFKKAAAPFGAALGTAKLSEIVDQVKDFECCILTSLRTDSNDKTKVHLQLNEVVVM